MAITQYQRRRFAGQDLEDLQDRIEEFSNQIYDSAIISGRLIEDTTVVSGSATGIPHNLGRPAKGVILVKSTVQLDIWQPTASDSTHVYVQASANATVNLWVF